MIVMAGLILLGPGLVGAHCLWFRILAPRVPGAERVAAPVSARSGCSRGCRALPKRHEE